MTIFAFVLIICTVFFCNSAVDATICKPLSAFKIDCDECICSSNGREYTCYTRECKPEINYRFNPRDYPLELKRSNDIPYINDEIPSSEESFENEFDDVRDYYDDKRDNLQNVDAEEDASVYDTAIPNEYRYRRSLKPLALNLLKKKLT